MKSFPHLRVCLCLGLCSLGFSAWGSFDHSTYDAVLRQHVVEGLVNYSELKEDARLDEYLAQIEKADLSTLKSKNEKVAFWTNAYNAYTLKLILNYYPVASIMDIKEPGYNDPWEIPLAKVAGKAYTLNQIENEILRPKWPDSRIHYALVCAAMSCPQLRNEAYTASRLDAQLDEQSRWFMIHRNSFDFKKRKATLSKVYEWYSADFGKNSKDTLKTLIPHAQPRLAKALKNDLKEWNIAFSEWNWQLNEQRSK